MGEKLEGSWTSIGEIPTGSHLLQEAFSDLPSLLNYEPTNVLSMSRAVIGKSFGTMGAQR